MEVFGYLRTSNLNKRNAENSDSQVRQKKAIKRFCSSKKWKIKDFYYDLGVSGDSGTDLSNREAFSDMLSEMKSNGIKRFVVADSSRLARSVITAAIINDDLRKHGISAIDAATGRDLADNTNISPEDQLIQNILLCISEFEKVKTVSRLQAARKRKKKAGGSIGGQRPFGATDEEQRMIQRIKELRSIWKDESGRMTKTRITQILNDEGFRNRRGGKFSLQSLSMIIKDNKL
jgi:DNA invertase Pin-like site-specific DNA recombinase